MEHPFRHHLYADDWSPKDRSKERNHPITKSQMPTDLKHQHISHLENPEANKSWLASPLLKFHESNLLILTFQQVSYLQKCWFSKPPTRQSNVLTPKAENFWAKCGGIILHLPSTWVKHSLCLEDHLRTCKWLVTPSLTRGPTTRSSLQDLLNMGRKNHVSVRPGMMLPNIWYSRYLFLGGWKPGGSDPEPGESSPLFSMEFWNPTSNWWLWAGPCIKFMG